MSVDIEADARRTVADYIIGRRADLNLGELTDGTSLIDAGVLDSLFVVDLVAFLERRFAISIQPEDVSPENFETLATIGRLVASKARAR
jgi:acyl carrier protein